MTIWATIFPIQLLTTQVWVVKRQRDNHHDTLNDDVSSETEQSMHLIRIDLIFEDYLSCPVLRIDLQRRSSLLSKGILSIHTYVRDTRNYVTQQIHHKSYADDTESIIFELIHTLLLEVILLLFEK